MLKTMLCLRSWCFLFHEAPCLPSLLKHLTLLMFIRYNSSPSRLFFQCNRRRVIALLKVETAPLVALLARPASTLASVNTRARTPARTPDSKGCWLVTQHLGPVSTRLELCLMRQFMQSNHDNVALQVLAGEHDRLPWNDLNQCRHAVSLAGSGVDDVCVLGIQTPTGQAACIRASES